jgi:hypothetical protein
MTEGLVTLPECIRKILQKDEAQDKVLVFGGVDVPRRTQAASQISFSKPISALL